MKETITKCFSISGIVALEYIAYLHGIDGFFLATGALIIGHIAGVPIKESIKAAFKKGT